MSNNINWGMIQDGATFESLVEKIVYYFDSRAKLFGRPGRDAAQDIVSGDGTTVYQAKFYTDNNFDNICKLALEELDRIKKYKTTDGYERVVWDGISKWIIVSNFMINPNDNNKWNRIVECFQEIDIEASYWGKEILEAKLVDYPALIQEYFQGESRIFATIPEAMSYFRLEPFSEQTLNVSLVARNTENAVVEQFMYNDKVILPLCGAGGVGKTRFLLEAGRKYAERGWLVFWANVESMTQCSNWYYALPPEKQVLLLVDEPGSSSLITRLFEQSQLRNWKIIVSFRSSKHYVLSALKKLRAGIIADSLNLQPFSPETARQFAGQLAKLSNIEIDSVLQERIARSVGYRPIWIAIAIRLLVIKGNLNDFPDEFEKIADEYYAEMKSAAEEYCSSEEFDTLFRWVALYGKINLEDISLMKFLARVEGMPPLPKFKRIIAVCRAQNLIKSYGVNNRIQKITPDVMRDFLLTKWLVIRQDAPVAISGEAEELVNFLLTQQDVPYFADILQSLANIEYTQLRPGNENGVISRIFNVLTATLESSSSVGQYNILRFTRSIMHCFPSKALDLYCYIVDNPAESVNVPTFLGETQLSHDKIVREIPWDLYCLSEYLSSPEDDEHLKRIFSLLITLCLREKKNNITSYNGKDANDLLPRLMHEERDPFLFSALARDKILTVLDQLGSNSYSEDSAIVFDILIKAIATFQKQRNHVEGNSLHLVTSYLEEDDLVWRWIEEIHERSKDIISNRALDKKSHLLGFSAFLQTFGVKRSYMYFLLRHGKMDSGQKLTKWAFQELRWLKEQIISSALSIDEMTVAKNAWTWEFQFGDGPLKEIAQECEDAYLQSDDIRLLEALCTYNNLSKQTESAREIALRLVASQKISAFREFCQKYYDFKKQHPAIDTNVVFVAKELRILCDENPIILEYAKEAINEKETIDFFFASDILREYLNLLRENNRRSDYESLLSSSMGNIPSEIQANLLFRIYYDARPFDNRQYTSFDLMLIINSEASFVNAEPAFFQLIAAVAHVDWDNAINCISRKWFGLSNADSQKDKCLGRFIDSIYSYFLVKRNYVSIDHIPETVINFIFSKIAEVNNLELLLSYELECLVKASCKMEFRWFIELIQKRMELESSNDAKHKEVFQVFPFRFEIAKWIQLSYTESELTQFLSLCEINSVMQVFLPQLVIEIDDLGEKSCSIIVGKISHYKSTKDFDKVQKWAQLASCYPIESPYWHQVAIAICEYADSFLGDKKIRLYNCLTPSMSPVMSWEGGGIAPQLYDKIEQLRKLRIAEKDTALWNYWDFRIKSLEHEIDWHKEVSRDEED